MNGSGVGDFWKVLQEYRNISLWPLSVAGGLPLLTTFVGIDPPSPKGIVYFTAVLTMLFAVAIFHFAIVAKRVRANKLLFTSLSAATLSLLAYFYVYSLVVISLPDSSDRVTKGFSCTSEFVQAFPERHCEETGLRDLQTAEYKPDQIWTRVSISQATLFLALSWLIFWVSFASLIVSFVSFQLRQKSRLPK